jgi:hypothetical protein
MSMVFVVVALLFILGAVAFWGRWRNQRCGEDKYARAAAAEDYRVISLLAILLACLLSAFWIFTQWPGPEVFLFWLAIYVMWVFILAKSPERLFSGPMPSDNEWLQWMEHNRQESLLNALEKQKKLPKLLQDKMTIAAAEKVQRERSQSERRRALTDPTYWEEKG